MTIRQLDSNIFDTLFRITSEQNGKASVDNYSLSDVPHCDASKDVILNRIKFVKKVK